MIRVGDPVTVQSAALGERTGIVRGFRHNEDGDAPFVVVDVDRKPGEKRPDLSLMGWVFEERQVKAAGRGR